MQKVGRAGLLAQLLHLVTSKPGKQLQESILQKEEILNSSGVPVSIPVLY